MMGIGVKAIRAIKRRNSKVSKRMMKHACCFALVYIILTIVSAVLFARMMKKAQPEDWRDDVWVEQRPYDNDTYEVNY